MSVLLKEKLLKARSGGDQKELWNAFTALWAAGRREDVTTAEFRSMFYDGDTAQEAVALVSRSAVAKQSLQASAELFPYSYGAAYGRVLMAVMSPEGAIEVWRRTHQSWTARDRRARASTLVSALLEQQGNEWTRARVLSLWRDGTIEEERESFLRVLDQNGALTDAVLDQLGAEAHSIARAAALGVRGGGAFSMQGAGHALERVGTLLRPLRVPVDLRDAGLRPEELGRLTPRLPLEGLLARAFRDLRDYSELTVLFDALRETAGGLALAQAAGARDELRLPILQLLHLRMILEAPALAPALQRPEAHLVPELLLYVLDRDGVSYSPELRIPKAEPRWSSRWVETTAEALSLIFLERTLELDLPTVSRIEEGREQAADFRAQTRQGKPTVIESKGSRSWKTHEKQRSEALAQVRASLASKGPGAWQEERGFACCLYSAMMGAETSTLLHVADPPVDRDRIFYHGWQDDARRRHYAAVAEAAGLFVLADRLLRRGPPEAATEEEGGQPPPSDTEHIFAFGEDDRLPRFVGTLRSLEREALVLRHPRSSQFRGARLFIGMTRSLHQSLKLGKIPDKPLDDGERGASQVPPGTGVLPSNGGSPRGVYSLLSNGAFVALEIEKRQ